MNGDTVSLINSLKAANNLDFVSTAGGAFLEFLEGKKLPGIKRFKLICQNLIKLHLK